MKTKTIKKPKEATGIVCLLAWAKQVPDLEAEVLIGGTAGLKKISSEIHSRLKFDVFIDAGGPNRLDPGIQDPPALLFFVYQPSLIKTDISVWRIPVSELGGQLVTCAAVRALGQN